MFKISSRKILHGQGEKHSLERRISATFYLFVPPTIATRSDCSHSAVKMEGDYNTKHYERYNAGYL
jgi:hypothetical protein